MGETANTMRDMRGAGRGRLLTAAEADFLLQCLTESEPAMIPGQASQPRKGSMGVPHLPRPKRLVH